ncbi:hypothetical protein B0T17DRAFT_483915 [Bombardia bombarda]|uniref:hydroxyisourate hydrolase n=1 Tax=Bombardia bombarda TaxID=252184 RepID=A0AA40CFP6_9PEZI|nr:hypothetical protein B0T17DRAFT_483915 [Bombardia bombarda]
MATPTLKDRITCHVLDTSLGKPARGVRVKLELEHDPLLHSSSTTTASSTASPSATIHPHHPLVGGAPKVFEGQTNDDGRITSWLPDASAHSSGEVPVYTLEDVLESLPKGVGPSRWTLRFDTGAYFGGEDKTFFPEVVVVFRVDEGQHYHVPLLLAPYSYSTYRGS